MASFSSPYQPELPLSLSPARSLHLFDRLSTQDIGRQFSADIIRPDEVGLTEDERQKRRIERATARAKAAAEKKQEQEQNQRFNRRSGVNFPAINILQTSTAEDSETVGNNRSRQQAIQQLPISPNEPLTTETLTSAPPAMTQSSPIASTPPQQTVEEQSSPQQTSPSSSQQTSSSPPQATPSSSQQTISSSPPQTTSSSSTSTRSNQSTGKKRPHQEIAASSSPITSPQQTSSSTTASSTTSAAATQSSSSSMTTSTAGKKRKPTCHLGISDEELENKYNEDEKDEKRASNKNHPPADEKEEDGTTTSSSQQVTSGGHNRNKQSTSTKTRQRTASSSTTAAAAAQSSSSITTSTGGKTHKQRGGNKRHREEIATSSQPLSSPSTEHTIGINKSVSRESVSLPEDPVTKRARQPATLEDDVTVSTVRDLFSKTDKKDQECLDDDDTIETMCSFETITEEERNNLQLDGCFLLPIQLLSIQYSLSVKSDKINYSIQEYGKMLKEALPNISSQSYHHNEEKKRPRGRPPKITPAVPNQKSVECTIDYSKYNNLSPNRIELKLYPIEKINANYNLHIDNNTIYLELFMYIDWNLFGEHANSTYGLLVSFQRNKSWHLKCVPISNILDGLQHKPEKRLELMKCLQNKYDADCALQKNFTSNQLRIVPFIMNKCSNLQCENEGYVVCAEHGLCICSICYDFNLLKEKPNLRTRALPHHKKGCMCANEHNQAQALGNQPRMNLVHFDLMEDDSSNQIQDDFDRVKHRMICPGYTSFDHNNIVKKPKFQSSTLLNNITKHIVQTFDAYKPAERNWISFCSLSRLSVKAEQPSFVLGNDRNYFTISNLIDHIKHIITQNHYFSSGELLISFLSCSLRMVEWFLDLPQAKNQYVIFLKSNVTDVSNCAKFPTLIQEFWQDKQQKIADAFENVAVRCGYTIILISYIDQHTRKVTEWIPGGYFQYSTYVYHETKWGCDYVDKKLSSISSEILHSQRTNTTSSSATPPPATSSSVTTTHQQVTKTPIFHSLSYKKQKEKKERRRAKKQQAKLSSGESATKKERIRAHKDARRKISITANITITKTNA